MRQPLMSGTHQLQNIGSGNTRYLPIITNDFFGVTANENETYGVVAVAGTINNLVVKQDSLCAAGTTRTYTLRVNDADTALTVTTTDAIKDVSDTTNSVSVNAGDRINLKVVNSGNPNTGLGADGVGWGMIFNGGTNQAILMSINNPNISGAWADVFTRLYGQPLGFIATAFEEEAFQVMPMSGTIKTLRMFLTAAPGSGNSITATLYKNSIATALTVTISDSNTTGVDSINTVSVVAGDLLYWRLSRNSTTPASTKIHIGAEFLSGNDSDSPIMGADTFSISSGQDNFSSVPGWGNGYYGQSEIDDGFSVNCVAPMGLTLSKLYVGLDFKSSSRDVVRTIQKNSSATALVATLAGLDLSGSDLTNTASFVEGDLIRFNTTVTVGFGPEIYWGLVVSAAGCSSEVADSSTSPKTMTPNGNFTIDTSTFKSGNGSGRFDGSSAYISSPDHNDWYLNGDFTLRFWVRFNTINNSSGVRSPIVGQRQDGSNYWEFAMMSNFVRMSINGTEIGFTPTNNLTTNTWYFIELTRSGSDWRFFVNGTQSGSTTVSSSSFSNLSGELWIGRSPGTPEIYFDGWLDEFELIKGVATKTTTTEIDDHRFRIDYVIDTQRPAEDILNDMLATFGGFLVYAGNKIKLRVEKQELVTQYFGDGSTTDQNATFDPNNIVKDSFSWSMSSVDDRPNRVRVQWVDPDQNYVKVYTQIEDRIDQDERGTIITKDVSLLGITRANQASRMAKVLMSSAKYAAINVAFSARLDSIHCEVGDVISITHQSARFVRRLQRITNMQEAEDETIRFTCKEYNPYIYDDRRGSSILVPIQSKPLNLSAPLDDVTGLALAESGFMLLDGTWVSNINASWTAIGDDQKLRLRNYLIQLSADGGSNYSDVGTADNDSTSFKITIGNGQTGIPLMVRVKTVSFQGAVSTGTTATITLAGDTQPPSDVTGFAGVFSTDHVTLGWNSVTDLDLKGYEIRQGDTNSIWETAGIVISQYLGTQYNVFNVTPGNKKYFIKAIDKSGNYSSTAASVTVSVGGASGSVVLFTFDLFSRIAEAVHPLEGTLSSDLDRVRTPDYNPLYNRIAFQPKTGTTWGEYETAGGTWGDLQGSSFRFGFEQYVTSEQSWQTEVVDIGSIVTGTFALEVQTYSPTSQGIVTPQISTSQDGVTFSSFANFISGQYTARYVKFKFLVKANVASAVIKLLSAVFSVSTP